MSPRTISTQQEALALANVVNPGGQRVNADGTVTPGIDGFHERNCALVAIATAAFLADGTQVAAFAAPGPLTVQANAPIVGHLVIGDENVRTEFDYTFPVEQYQQRIAELRERFPGQSFIVQGIGEKVHHWFNITAEGTVFDAQVGLLNEDVIRGQHVHDGLREFDELRIYPVNPARTGQEIIKDAQDMHQALTMSSLAQSLGSAHYHVVNDAWASIVSPHVEQQEKLGRTDIGSIQNEVTPQFFNVVCESLAFEIGEGDVDKGRALVVAAMAEKLTFATNEDGGKQWGLTDAAFREPGSVTAGPRVVDVYRDKCPMLDEAMTVVERNVAVSSQPQSRPDDSFGR